MASKIESSSTSTVWVTTPILSRRRYCNLTLVLAVLGFGVACFATTAFPVSVTCTGAWPNYSTGGGPYDCVNTIDGVTDDTAPGLGGNNSYWLGRDVTWGTSDDETLTFDLGFLSPGILGFEIYNSHNGLNPGGNDRGTLTFDVWVSSSPVTPDTNPASSFGTLVLSNQSLAFPTVDPNPDQSFAITPIGGRYVTFRALTFTGAGAGLSEFQVDVVVPEPTSAKLVIVALAALLILRWSVAATRSH